MKIYIIVGFCLSGMTFSETPREGKEVVVTANKNTTIASKNSNLQSLSQTNRDLYSSDDCSDQNARAPDSCSTNEQCQHLNAECLDCAFNCTCIYGASLNVSCKPKSGVTCSGTKEIIRTMKCRYCYQTNEWEHVCIGTEACRVIGAMKETSYPRETFISNCTVQNNIVCLGTRTFPKKLPCNWTSGYKWSTALLLSVTLGGFGADRFYLGHWQEGIGKLFSFGGLGVWTILDVILIGVRYLGPADGSLYI